MPSASVIRAGAAGWLASHGDPVDRLVGAELGSAVVALAVMLFAQFMNQSQYLIVPLVLTAPGAGLEPVSGAPLANARLAAVRIAWTAHARVWVAGGPGSGIAPDRIPA